MIQVQRSTLPNTCKGGGHWHTIAAVALTDGVTWEAPPSPTRHGCNQLQPPGYTTAPGPLRQVFRPDSEKPARIASYRGSWDRSVSETAGNHRPPPGSRVRLTGPVSHLVVDHPSAVSRIS